MAKKERTGSLYIQGSLVGNNERMRHSKSIYSSARKATYAGVKGGSIAISGNMRQNSKSIRPKKIIDFPHSIDMNLISDEDVVEAK